MNYPGIYITMNAKLIKRISPVGWVWASDVSW